MKKCLKIVRKKEAVVKTCILCNSKYKVLFNHKSLSGPLVKCVNCDLIWVDITGDLKPIKDFQSADERKDAYLKSARIALDKLNIKSEIEISEREKRKINFAYRVRKINKIWQKPKDSTNLLEIGCGEGLFLDQARNSGYQVSGIEPNEKASRYARDILGINVTPATLAESEIEHDSIDIVVMLHVLEHLLDPRKEISEIRNILKKNGLLVLELPNIGSLPYKLLRKKWRQFSIPDHYWFFSKKTITILLEKQGFKIIQIKSIGKRVSFRFFLNRLERTMRIPAIILGRLAKYLRLEEKTLYINPLDIMIVFARKVE